MWAAEGKDKLGIFGEILLDLKKKWKELISM